MIEGGIANWTQMHIKKTAILVAAVATIPAAIVSGYLIADSFYMRFVFVGQRSEFAPGDTIGVLVWTMAFTTVLVLVASFGWLHFFRKHFK